MVLDLHIHSKYSFDSFLSANKIIKVAKKKGLNGIAITDHNTIKGALEASKINKDKNFVVIIGSEIATDKGDIIGLFLEKEIETTNFDYAVSEIHRQGGITVLPHPYKGHKLDEINMESIDIVEVANSRISGILNEKARRLAQKNKIPGIAGSDAHFCAEIGNNTTIINSNDIRKEILAGSTSFKEKGTYYFLQTASQLIKAIKYKQYGKLPFLLLLLIRDFLFQKKQT